MTEGAWRKAKENETRRANARAAELARILTGGRTGKRPQEIIRTGSVFYGVPRFNKYTGPRRPR